MTKLDKIHHAKRQVVINALDNIYQMLATSAEDTEVEIGMIHYIEANIDDVVDALDITVVL